MSDPWSREEVEATVADYFNMLILELTGQPYSKTDHRHKLQQRLTNRSEGAIERKHQNISAILIELHCPWISGYKPLGNYQFLLFDVVEDRLKGTPHFDQIAVKAAQLPAGVPPMSDFSAVIVDAPRVRRSAQESQSSYKARTPKPAMRRDYLAQEARNSSLGLAGERFIVDYERWRLASLGKEKLAEKVEHVSVTQGDGLGFDILSFEASGRDRLIEVKTTSFGRETPFFITRSEVDLSRARSDTFYLYRLFEFRRAPRLFSLRGRVDSHCNLDPITFQARFT
jgi:hypothetical protein